MTVILCLCIRLYKLWRLFYVCVFVYIYYDDYFMSVYSFIYIMTIILCLCIRLYKLWRLFYVCVFVSDLCKIILTSKQRGLLPILGDTNCRYGNLNCIFREQNICYGEIVVAISYHHGRTYGTDMCISCNIFLVNHLKMCNKTYAGDFTYFKGYKKSQIYFVYTDRIGIKHLKKFDMVAANWHLSDHRPVFVPSEHIFLCYYAVLKTLILSLIQIIPNQKIFIAL